MPFQIHAENLDHLAVPIGDTDSGRVRVVDSGDYDGTGRNRNSLLRGLDESYDGMVEPVLGGHPCLKATVWPIRNNAFEAKIHPYLQTGSLPGSAFRDTKQYCRER